MKISQIANSYNSSNLKENIKSEISLHKDEKDISKKESEITNLTAKDISNSYFFQYQKEIVKSLNELTSDEANDLISENGFFGIANTAERIASFVLNGAGDDVEKLKAGIEGVAKGFEDAKKIWGGELPEISQKTIEKTLETLDKKIAELGGNFLNVSA